MLFNSYIFLFLFLPLCLLGWYGLNAGKQYKLAQAFLAGMSLWFYGYFNVYYLAIIVGSIAGNFFLSFLLKQKNTPFMRKCTLLIGLLFNFGLLFYYKYFDFFLENVNVLFRSDFTLRHIVLPLGISFFTFQQVSFIVDRCLERAPHYSFLNYVTFVTFFPQLIAGPIVFYHEVMPQFEDYTKRIFDRKDFVQGFILFTIGLGKKVLLADTLAVVANAGFAKTELLDSPSTLLTLLAYTFEIYFDFSGYSDMAMGLGSMFRIQLPQNFNSPYKACTVKELWQRWHITLSRFFIQYVYIPLGGSRKGKLRKIVNNFLVFFLSGLWHGANWTYVAWGSMQGLLVVLDQLGLVGIKGREEKGNQKTKWKVPAFIGWCYTFGMFVLSLIFFRSESMSKAFIMFRNLFSFKVTGYLPKLVGVLELPELYIVKEALSLKFPTLLYPFSILQLLVLLVISIIVLCKPNAKELVLTKQRNTGFALFLTVVFVWSIISFSQVSTFIYFDF